MDYRDNRHRWAESHQVVHFYAGQWCTFTPALTACAAFGISSQVRPRYSRPLAFFERLWLSLPQVPHCLKLAYPVITHTHYM